MKYRKKLLEIIPVTDKAGKNLDEVEIWKK